MQRGRGGPLTVAELCAGPVERGGARFRHTPDHHAGGCAHWEAAKRMARVSATLETELGNHLGQCHLNIEQYAIAACRNLRHSPLRWLLMPHLREVVLINHSASSFLVRPKGYLTLDVRTNSSRINSHA